MGAERSSHVVYKNLTNGRLFCQSCSMAVGEPEDVRDLKNAPTNYHIHSNGNYKRHPEENYDSSASSASVSQLDQNGTVRRRAPLTYLDEPPARGLTGITNIGNSCYFNSAIQVLSNSRPLSAFLRSQANFWIFADKRLCWQLSSHFQQLWSRHPNPYIDVSMLLSTFKSDNRFFNNLRQHDAHELFRCLLTQLDEELSEPMFDYEENLRAKKPKTSPQNDTSILGSTVGSRSVIKDIFEGRIESTELSLSMTMNDINEPKLEKTEKEDPGVTTEVSKFTRMVNSFTDTFFSTSIDLIGCLEEYFKPALLFGDNAYRCEKCKSPQKGTKYCQISSLPEVLCIHLKRFKMDAAGFKQKVSTHTLFPVYGLNLAPYALPECTKNGAKYELSGMVIHSGNQAESGHYTACCRNLDDGNWYTFDDKDVMKIDPIDLLSREAYFLLYQRIPNEKQRLGGEFSLLTKMEKNWNQSEENFTHYICREYLERIRSFSNPGPIPNTSFLCAHGKISPRKSNNIEAIVTKIPGSAWRLLQAEFGGGPELESLDFCEPCEKELKALCKSKEMELRQFAFEELDFFEQWRADGRNPTQLCVVPRVWHEKWMSYVTRLDEVSPGPINNKELYDENQDPLPCCPPRGKTVSQKSFEMFVELYGGGPTVRCMADWDTGYAMYMERLYEHAMSMDLKKTELYVPSPNGDSYLY
ncbi:unnamed protein product, partial [Mesorhabditis spiculigera]